MIMLPDRTTSDEVVVARFLNSTASWQLVTDGPDATCPVCGYPERHRIYDVDAADWTLMVDGCPSCETSRMPTAGAEVPEVRMYGPDCREGKWCCVGVNATPDRFKRCDDFSC